MTTLDVRNPAADWWRALTFGAEEAAEELAWQESALCAQTDPEAFFPEKGASSAAAKQVCSACPVRTECLEYALARGERYGIWGGLSERERRKLKASRGMSDTASITEGAEL